MADAQRCQGCGYDLSNPPESIPEPRCPECGLHYLPGEHPTPEWPGAGAVFLECSGLYLSLLVLGTSICFLPAGLGLGYAILIPAAAIGIIAPIQSAKSYGTRFPTESARWKSRRRVWLLSTALNAAAMLIVFLILRHAAVR
jgi:hypothetical protein